MVYLYLNQSFFVILRSSNFSVFYYMAKQALEQVGQKGHIICVLKVIKNWTRQSPEQPDLIFMLDPTWELTLLWMGHLMISKGPF